MQDSFQPDSARALAERVRTAAARNEPLEISGGASKAEIGRPSQAVAGISMRGWHGITLYEPAELVVTAKSGTPLAVLEAELSAHNQTLAAEPIDLGLMLGGSPARTTVGGMLATNLSGSRRISAGAVRDHVLGVNAVNGRGEIIGWGGRVMKNVTGYDLCRGLSGSWGTLAIFTDITLKVMPRPEDVRTLLLYGQPDEIAIEVLCAAVGTPYEVSAAVHLDKALTARFKTPHLREAGAAVTALRIENFTASTAYRAASLKALFGPYGEMSELDHAASVMFWKEMRELAFLAASTDPVWRISTAPKTGPRVVEAIRGYMPCRAAYDWSGGLVWLEVPRSADAGSADIRRIIATRGGHATLIRAEAPVRAAVEVFQPLEFAAQRLTRRLKDAFDPAHILNKGRMYADV